MRCNVLQLSWTEHGQRKAPSPQATMSAKKLHLPKTDSITRAISGLAAGACVCVYVCMLLEKESLKTPFPLHIIQRYKHHLQAMPLSMGKQYVEHMFNFSTMNGNRKMKACLLSVMKHTLYGNIQINIHKEQATAPSYS